MQTFVSAIAKTSSLRLSYIFRISVKKSAFLITPNLAVLCTSGDINMDVRDRIEFSERNLETYTEVMRITTYR